MDPLFSLLANAPSAEQNLPIMPAMPFANVSTTAMPDSSGSFKSVLAQAVSQVNYLQLEASARQQALNAGQSDDLAGAMVASQKANISFAALLQVRNKLASGLDDLINTPL